MQRQSATFAQADMVRPASLAQDDSQVTALTPATPQTNRRLAELPLATLALMGAATFLGNGWQAPYDLAPSAPARHSDNSNRGGATRR
jgi:hypothetical protein